MRRCRYHGQPDLRRGDTRPWFSHGLDPILRERQYKLHGILNGIDTDIYNPETDKAIAKNFSAKDPAGKKEDKADLQREFSPAPCATMCQ